MRASTINSWGGRLGTADSSPKGFVREAMSGNPSRCATHVHCTPSSSCLRAMLGDRLSDLVVTGVALGEGWQLQAAAIAPR